MSALEIAWTVRGGNHCRTHETKIGQQCVVAVDEWVVGQLDWRVSVCDDLVAQMLTLRGKADTLDQAKETALSSVDGAFAALKRAIGPDLAGAIRQAQASVDAAREADERGEWAEPETLAASSLAQLAEMAGARS